MLIYKLSFICALLLSEAAAQEGDGGSEESGQLSSSSTAEDGDVGQNSEVPSTAEEGDVSQNSEAPSTTEEGDVSQNSDVTSEDSMESPPKEFVATQQDIANFRQTFQRYSERMADFQQEAIVMVGIKETELKNELLQVYDKPLLAIEADKMELRETAVSKFQQFLQKYPDKPQGAEIRFQLADIYFDEAQELYDKKQREQDRLYDENPDIELSPVQIDFDRVVALHTEIVEKFPESTVADGALFLLGYFLKQSNSDQYDEEGSFGYYQRLVDEHPDSPFAAGAHYAIANYYFNTSQESLALGHFQKAVALSQPEEGEYDSQYENALYLLAWTNYRLNNFDQALQLFTRFQDYSSRMERDTGDIAGALEESLEYTAYCFIDQEVLSDLTVLEIGQRYYEENGEREYSPQVFVALAKILEKQVLVEDAMNVYRYLQEKWPYAPENPSYQKKVATILFQQGEEALYNEALRELTEVYAENGEWWRQNRNNPEAQELAKSYIEGFLLEVADNQLALAYASQDPEDFRLAAEHYRNYISKFPFADDFYDAQWFLSIAYEESNQIDEAIEQFEQLMKSAEDHNYGEMAEIKKLSRIYGEVKNSLGGDFTSVSEGAEVVQKELLSDDSERLIYAIPSDIQTFITAYQNALELDFGRRIESVQQQIAETDDPKALASLKLTAENLGYAAEFLPSKKKSYEYNIGQIYAAHGQLDLARERFNRVIDLFPESVEAEFSASAIIRGYQDQLDWPMVKQEAERFIVMQLGPDDKVPENDFAEYIQSANLQIVQKIFYDGQKLKAEGKTQEGVAQLNLAAQGYEDYLEQYPDIPTDDYANTLLRAANAYGDARNIEEANRLNKKYVDMFPQRTNSRPILFAIAENHQAALEFEEAIKYYDILYQQTYGKGIPYQDGITAKFNSAYLKAGLGDYEGAAKGFEAYVKKFPDLVDSERVYFQTGQYWEKVNDFKALEFYTRYLKKYGDQNADRTMQAHYRRIEIYRKQGNKERFLNREWTELMKSYERLLAKNGEASVLMRQYAAEYELAEIPDKLKKFKSFKFTRSDKRNAELLTESNEAFLAIKDECLSLGEKYKDLAAVMAGAYCVGSAQLFLVDFKRAVPLDNYDYDFQILFEEKTEAEVEPIETAGLAGLEGVLQIAEKREVWNEWAELALAELSSRDPESYPPQKTEVRYRQDSQYVPILSPVSIEVEKSRIVDVSEEAEVMSPQDASNSEMPEETEGGVPEVPEDGVEQNAEEIDGQEETQQDLPTWGSPKSEEREDEQPQQGDGEGDEQEDGQPQQDDGEGDETEE